MKKIAYIIPGFGESHLKQKGYDKIAGFFSEKGIKPIHININWHLKKPIDFEKYNQQFLKKFKKPKNTKIYILGFSYGAVISFLTAVKTKPYRLILCSLSPYFKEDYKNLKPQWLKWWKKNFKNEYSFNEVSPSVKSKTFLLAGSKEGLAVNKRARSAKSRIKNSSFVSVKNAKHNISQKEYLLGLKNLIQTL